MVEYRLNIHLDDRWLRAWSESPGMKLCFSTSVGTGSSKSHSNVVAYTSNIAPAVSIPWSNKYQMSATDSQFSNGVQIVASTNAVDVQFGSKTTVSQDWTISSAPDADAPPDGFLFTNQRISAPLLLQQIHGEFRPIYTSRIGPLPIGSEERMIPNNKVYVLFADHDSGNMVDDFRGAVKEIDMTGKTVAEVKFGAEGQWVDM